MMKPGDILTTDDGREFLVGDPMTYRGRPDCDSVRCTRRGMKQRDDGSWFMGVCFGWHCVRCDEPCSSMGHQCPEVSA